MSFFNRNKRSDGRQGTFSLFSKKFTETEAPKAPEPAKLKTEERSAPTYAHADRQKGPVDKEAEEREHEDEEIRQDKGKDKKDPEQAKTDFEPPAKTVTRNERQDGPSTSGITKAPQTFNRFWKLELEYDLEEEIESESNYWTPNGFALFEILRASGKYVYDNATVLKRHVDYLDYAVATYYAILFYIQILRAQKAAGKISGPDRSFFNRFKDRFPFEELVVSSIFEPFFSTIVATLPKDGKYDWIIPRYGPELINMDPAAAYAPGNGTGFIQPLVPYMLRILRSSITATRVTNAQANTADYFNDDDIYVPHTITAANATNIFGQQYQKNQVRADDANTLFSALGINYPFFANLDQLSAAAPKIRKSKFKAYRFGDGLDAAPAPQPGRPANYGAGEHLAKFLEMAKTDDVDWFFELIRQASLHSRFFDGVTNLSKIPTTSGNESLITCRFKQIVNRAEVTHANVQLGMRAAAAAIPEWYPDTFRNYLGSFYTTREGVNRQETLQAFTNGTNGTISVTYQAGPPAYRIGEGPEYRTGPYWQNKEWAATKFADSGINGKPMFRGWETMFQDDAALEKPTGY